MVYARGNGMSEAARAQRGNASVLKTEGTGWDVGHAVKFLLSAYAHLPVAASGGPLAFVRTGDRIRISVTDRRIDLLVGEVELAQRRQTTKRAASVPSRGYARLFHREILLADEGCDFRSLTAHPTHD
jgi:hypothetical protein